MIYNQFPREEVIIDEWLDFTLQFNNYSSNDYSVTYYFVGDGSNYEIPLTAQADGSFLFQALVEGAAGEYKYQGVATDALGHKFYVDSGTVTSIVNYASLPNGQDNRSHVKKVLDALEAMIEGKATSDQIYYMIEGRALSRIPPDQLMIWYEKYKAMYEREKRVERQKKGKVSGKIIVGFR